jgi:hypothetical protein
MRRLVLAGLVAFAGGQFVLSDPAAADHRRHWFFGSYERYDEDAFNYRRQPQLYRPRRPIIEYDSDEYRAERRRQKSHPWRERRVRYDLTPGERRKAANKAFRKQLHGLARPPLPREKPYIGYVHDDAGGLTSSGHTAALGTAEDVRPTQPVSRSTERTSKRKPVSNRLSCRKAKEIVAGFGFTDIQANSCDGRTYSFAAQRDGKPFTISLSSSSGELTEVKRQ